MAKQKKKVMQDLAESMTNIDLVTPSESMNEQGQEYIDTKIQQTKMLAAKFAQSKFARAIQVEDSRDRILALIVEKLENTSPGMLLQILESLSIISEKNVVSLLGNGGGKQGSGGVNLQITQMINNQQEAPLKNPPILDNTGVMKTMKALANIHGHIVDEARKIEAVEVKVEEVTETPPKKPKAPKKATKKKSRKK